MYSVWVAYTEFVTVENVGDALLELEYPTISGLKSVLFEVVIVYNTFSSVLVV
jgi:hypothetical protein